MSKPKIIFAGTAAFACPALRAVHKHCDVTLVLTQPQHPAGRGLNLKASPVDLLAQEFNIPILRPETVKRSYLESELASFECDFLVVAAYGKIIPQWLLDWPKLAPLNVHGSLLPRWRGAAPIQHALLHDDKESGATIIHMTPGLDEGPIYAFASCPISADDDQHTLGNKIALLGADLLIETILDFNMNPKPQLGIYNYAPKIQKNNGLVDWKKSAHEIYCQYRAFKSWPGLYCFDKNKLRVKINEIKPTSLNIEHLELGQSYLIDNKLYVKTGAGCLELLNIQFEGKNPIVLASALKDKNHWLYHQLIEFNCEF